MWPTTPITISIVTATSAFQCLYQLLTESKSGKLPHYVMELGYFQPSCNKVDLFLEESVNAYLHNANRFHKLQNVKKKTQPLIYPSSLNPTALNAKHYLRDVRIFKWGKSSVTSNLATGWIFLKQSYMALVWVRAGFGLLLPSCGGAMLNYALRIK